MLHLLETESLQSNLNHYFQFENLSIALDSIDLGFTSQNKQLGVAAAL